MIRSLNGISQKILHNSANYQDDCVSTKHKIHDGFHADEQRQSKIRYGNEALLWQRRHQCWHKCSAISGQTKLRGTRHALNGLTLQKEKPRRLAFHLINDALALALPRDVGEPHTGKCDAACGMLQAPRMDRDADDRTAIMQRHIRSKNTTAHLPCRSTRPIVAVAPTLVKDLPPCRRAAVEHPAPCFAPNLHRVINPARTDQQIDREVGEIRRGDCGRCLRRITQTFARRVARK